MYVLHVYLINILLFIMLGLTGYEAVWKIETIYLLDLFAKLIRKNGLLKI